MCKESQQARDSVSSASCEAKPGFTSSCHGLSYTAWVWERIPALFVYPILRKRGSLEHLCIMFAHLPSTPRLLFLDLAWLIARTGLLQPLGMRGGCIGSGEEAAVPCLRLSMNACSQSCGLFRLSGTALLCWQLPRLELVAGDATP